LQQGSLFSVQVDDPRDRVIVAFRHRSILSGLCVIFGHNPDLATNAPLGDNAALRLVISGFGTVHSGQMVFEHIEKLKRAFTDKYVVVDAARPELARFGNAIGLVKTVNMNGRALVEFDQYDNIGWYDIELDFLKVVPKPEPKLAEAKKEAAGKAATQKGTEKVTAPAAAPKQVAAAKAAAKPAAPQVAAATAKAGAGLSTADILAAARVKKGTGEPVSASAKAGAPAAAAKPAPAAAPGKKMSTAEILAMARGKGTAPAAVAAAAAPTKPKVAPTEPAPLTSEEAAEPTAEMAPVTEPAATKPKAPPSSLPTTTAEKIAYCRRVDAKGK
jgi:hypothetical protein